MMRGGDLICVWEEGGREKKERKVINRLSVSQSTALCVYCICQHRLGFGSF